MLRLKRYGEEGVLTFQETIQGTHLESYFISYQSLVKEHLTKSPSLWDRKVILLRSFVGSNRVVRGCRLACTGLFSTHAALTAARINHNHLLFPECSKLFHAFVKGTGCSLYGGHREPGSFATLYFVATPPSPLGLRSKISFSGKCLHLPGQC